MGEEETGCRQREPVKSGDSWRDNFEGGKGPKAFLSFNQTISSQIMGQRPQPLSASPIVSITFERSLPCSSTSCRSLGEASPSVD